jgi:hypothetical protein
MAWRRGAPIRRPNPPPARPFERRGTGARRTQWARRVCLFLAPIIAGLALLASVPRQAGAEPVATIVRGAEPDGSERLVEDLALLWRASYAFDASSLAVTQQAEPRARLRAVRLGRAEFAVLDAASFAALRTEFPDMVVLSALIPLPVHVLERMADPGPLRNTPGTIVFTAHARFVAEALVDYAAAAAPAGAPAPAPPLLRREDPLGAIDLLKRGLPADTLVLLAAPKGTQELAAALQGDPGLRLLALSGELLDAVRRERPWVFTTPIARGTYPNQADGVEAPVAHLLLVTSPQLPQDDARRMLDCLYGRRDQVAPFDALFASVDRRANADLAKWAPYHATAAKEFGLTP